MAEFLQWLAVGGGSIVAVSFLVERWAWFQAHSVEWKKAWSFVGSALIGVASYASVTYIPADVVDFLTPYFAVVAYAFSTYFVGQVFHKYDKFDSA